MLVFFLITYSLSFAEDNADKLEELRQEESIAIVKNFKQIGSPLMPESSGTIEHQTKPSTVDEYFRTRSFTLAIIEGTILNEYAGADKDEAFKAAQAFANEIKNNGDIEELFPTNWKSLRLEGMVYKVSVIFKNYLIFGSDAWYLYANRLPFKKSKHSTESYSFKVDLGKKTLQPLTLNAWGLIDKVAASNHLKLGDNADVSTISPKYNTETNNKEAKKGLQEKTKEQEMEEKGPELAISIVKSAYNSSEKKTVQEIIDKIENAAADAGGQEVLKRGWDVEEKMSPHIYRIYYFCTSTNQFVGTHTRYVRFTVDIKTKKITAEDYSAYAYLYGFGAAERKYYGGKK